MKKSQVFDETRLNAISQRASNTLRPKGLNVCSYVEKYAAFKIKLLKKSAGTQKCYAQRNTPGVGNFSN